jgi:hypothetical protein
VDGEPIIRQGYDRSGEADAYVWRHEVELYILGTCVGGSIGTASCDAEIVEGLGQGFVMKGARLALLLVHSIAVNTTAFIHPSSPLPNCPQRIVAAFATSLGLAPEISHPQFLPTDTHVACIPSDMHCGRRDASRIHM